MFRPRGRPAIGSRPVPRPPEPRRESAADILPGVPRVADLDALLGEIDGLRRTLETDLSCAAAATEAGALQVAIELLDADRAELGRFQRGALRHLRGIAARRRPRRLLLAAAPLTVAAALVGVVLTLPPDAPTPPPPPVVAAAASYAELEGLVRAQAPAADVVAAAERLHLDVETLLAGSGADPGAAPAALGLLDAERDVLLTLPAPGPPADVLARWTRLHDRVLAAIPAPGSTDQPPPPTE